MNTTYTCVLLLCSTFVSAHTSLLFQRKQTRKHRKERSKCCRKQIMSPANFYIIQFTIEGCVGLLLGRTRCDINLQTLNRLVPTFVVEKVFFKVYVGRYRREAVSFPGRHSKMLSRFLKIGNQGSALVRR